MSRNHYVRHLLLNEPNLNYPLEGENASASHSQR